MNRPRVRLGTHLLPGIAAVGVFVLIAGTILTAEFDTAVGFTGSVAETIGLALVNLGPADGYLVALILIGFVLDAALDGAVYLARREGGDQ